MFSRTKLPTEMQNARWKRVAWPAGARSKQPTPGARNAAAAAGRGEETCAPSLARARVLFLQHNSYRVRLDVAKILRSVNCLDEIVKADLPHAIYAYFSTFILFSKLLY